MKVFLVTIVFLCFSFELHASYYPWPIISSVIIENTSSKDAIYHITYDAGRIYDSDSWLNETPKECKATQCIFVIAHRHKIKNGSSTARFEDAKTMKIGSTWKEILYPGGSSLYSWASSITEIHHSGDWVGGECVMAGLVPNTAPDGTSWDNFVSKVVLPPSLGNLSCLGLPPLNRWCAVVNPSVEFDFGTLPTANAVGTSRVKNVTIECSGGDTDYVLKIDGNDMLYLNNGMTAKFTVDGNPLGGTLKGKTGNNSIKLETTLGGVPPADGGSFSGTGVLRVSYP